jgi:CrcB protein
MKSTFQRSKINLTIAALAAGLGLHLASNAHPVVNDSGTLTINVLGCLLIGMLVPVLAGHPREEHLRPFIVTGVLGGFTTFSAFALETGVMLDEGRLGLAGVYIGATLLLGLLAVPLGVRISRRIAG